MANQRQTSWAVLLCKLKDNLSDPPVPNFLSLCQKFFTTAGAGTFNAVQFFQDMSHGGLDLSGSQVFGWFTLDAIFSDLLPCSDPVDCGKRRNNMMALAKKTALDQGVPLENFFGVVLVFNVAVGGSQGGAWDGIPPNVGVFSDYRYVQNNGTESYGQEMGHAYGLDHSRSDAPNVNVCDPSTLDYRDPWDGMSTACAFFAPDPDYGARGPGFNAWNMRGRVVNELAPNLRWLDESRVWHGPTNPFDQVVQLSPLHRHDLPGWLAAELPPIDGHYLVEFRIKDRWDAAIPRSTVLVHRFEGIVGQFLGDHSYIMSGTKGNQDLIEGDTLDATASGSLEVFALGVWPNTPPGLAWHMKQLTTSSGFPDWSQLGGAVGLGRITVISGITGALEVFATDTAAGLAWTIFQDGPNGNFEGWVSIGSNKAGLHEIAAGRNANGRLEVFALDAQGVPWHTVQPTTSSGFPDWSQLGDAVGLGQIMVISGLNGGLEVFAVDTGAGFVWTNFQDGPNGTFEGWGTVGNRAGFRQVTAGRNADGRLEVFALDKTGQAWHTAQPTTSSGFPDWSQLGSVVTLDQITVARNADVAIHVEVLKIDEQGQTATLRLSSTPTG